MIIKKEGYIVLATNDKYINQKDIGRPIALDKSSGGYSWIPEDIRNVKLWDTLKDAEKYAVSFNYVARKATLTLEHE